MPIKGDFDKLAALRANLALAGQRGADLAAKHTADTALQLARGQVRRAEAPDGTPWEPLRLSDKEAQAIQRRADRAEARGRSFGGGRKPLRGVADDAVAGVGQELGVAARAMLKIPGEGSRPANTGTRRPRPVFGHPPHPANVEPQRQIVPFPGQALPDRWRKQILSRVHFVVWRLLRKGDAT